MVAPNPKRDNTTPPRRVVGRAHGMPYKQVAVFPLSLIVIVALRAALALLPASFRAPAARAGRGP